MTDKYNGQVLRSIYCGGVSLRLRQKKKWFLPLLFLVEITQIKLKFGRLLYIEQKFTNARIDFTKYI